ncbi:MoxR-like ATPase in aerotolerance operon [hydrothermal vent metagenome]|uniref:MoxR-like ATPase in aerotolerance operon n=1 Tax=hydrothermal vent metagenome TaxID=652676 RepID=A0A3B0ZZW1_9ZZZZ
MERTATDRSLNFIIEMNTALQKLEDRIGETIVGQQALIKRLLIALLADGHVLIEGAPGLAKTTAVQALADGINTQFQRIQFTPDLIPGDITGTDIFIPQEGHFQFEPGPIFNQIILADEINRAPPKVQSALLEAMQERQVTIGRHTRTLPELFLVIATQNPLEHEGTFPLPEAQLDRFFMKINLSYPSIDEEMEILRRDLARISTPTTIKKEPVINEADIHAARRTVQQVHMDTLLDRYIVTLVHATRAPEQWAPQLSEHLQHGASPRASLALSHAARAHAYLAGRDFVEPGDITALAQDILNHRIALSFAARAEGMNARDIINTLLDAVPIP